MAWKPNKWIAAILALIFPPIGMLYLNRVRLAGIYFLGVFGVVAIQFWLINVGRNVPLSLAYLLVAVVHSFWLAKGTPEIQLRPWFTRWYGLLGVVLVFVLGITSVRAFIVEPFRLPSQSMFPSIPKNSFILVQKYGYGNYATYGIQFFHGDMSASLNRGDVLVFEGPINRRISFVKRLVGLPGDHIVYKSKQLYVNGKLLQTKPIGTSRDLALFQETGYKIAIEPDTPGNDFDVTVAPGHVFVLGDNRDNSLDSRHLGAIPFGNIIGRVILVING